MSTVAPADVIERQEWLEPVENGLQKAVTGAFDSAGSAGLAVKDFLHGVWLKHPLHPVLTDVPIGGWTAALVLDIMDASGVKGCANGADVAIKVGLVGAAASAVTGLTDWSATDGPARRVGVTHGLLNLTAAGLYTTSMLQRGAGNRNAGRVLAFIGYAVSAAAAWLGGNLVYTKQIGVDHAAGQPYPEDWTAVLDDAELREAEPKRVDVNGTRVLLFRRTGQIYAIAEVCSHLGGPLAEGKVHGDTIECPWHGSQFCMRDGSVVSGPTTHPQPAFDTRVRDGRVEVKVRARD